MTIDFWIGTALALLSIGLSIWAAIEARAAKKEAKRAGFTIKIQTVAIDLSEIIQNLETIQDNNKIVYVVASKLVKTNSRKIKRLTAPLKSDDAFVQIIYKIDEHIKSIETALSGVSPYDNINSPVETSVYNAIASPTSNLCNTLSELMGLLEHRTINNK